VPLGPPLAVLDQVSAALVRVDAQIQMDLDVVVVLTTVRHQPGAAWFQLCEQVEEVHRRRLRVDMTLRIVGVQQHGGALG
jgi:hypothetical protein